MPIYEYICDNCGHQFELLVRGNDPPRCESCQGSRLNRLLSVPAAHVSGGRSDLPICERPTRGPCGMGGCGLPECG